MTPPLASPAPIPIAHEAWLDRLDDHGLNHGFHVRLSARHGALFTEDDETLLVTFENAETLRGCENVLPFGLSVAGRESAVWRECLVWQKRGFVSEQRRWGSAVQLAVLGNAGGYKEAYSPIYRYRFPQKVRQISQSVQIISR